MLSAGLANPADYLKVKMQAHGNTLTLGGHVRQTLAGPGWGGLYRALFPTMVRAGILTSSLLGTYDEAKAVLLRRRWLAEGPQVHLVASVRPCSIESVRLYTATGHRRRRLCAGERPGGHDQGADDAEPRAP
jgi:hypothetical protein